VGGWALQTHRVNRLLLPAAGAHRAQLRNRDAAGDSGVSGAGQVHTDDIFLHGAGRGARATDAAGVAFGHDRRAVGHRARPVQEGVCDGIQFRVQS
jgi:hypothetical protein